MPTCGNNSSTASRPDLNGEANSSCSHLPTGLTVKRKRRAPLSQTEIDALLQAAGQLPKGQDLRELIIVILNTGIRHDELASLRWSDVDLSRGTIEVNAGKGPCKRKVPFDRLTLEALQAFQKRLPDSEYVLGSNPKALLRKISAQLAKISVGIRKIPICLHDLRWSFMNRWIKGGGSLFVLAYNAGCSPSGLAIKDLVLPKNQFAATARCQEALERKTN